MGAARFTLTQQAARNDKNSRWELIAAIAEDAVAAGLPITSGDSMLAAQQAAASVGLELAAGTVAKMAITAKFDHESTPRQREEWRRYGHRAVQELAVSGWSQDDAYELLHVQKRRTVAEVRHAIREATVHVDPEPRDLNELMHRLLHDIDKWFTDMAKAADRAEAEGGLDMHSAMTLAIYQSLTEKRIDAELRQFFGEEANK